MIAAGGDVEAVEERSRLHAPSVKPADASGRAATILRHAIVGGDLVDGERLIAEQIAEEIGISRPLVMIAMRQLEREGLVRIGGNGRPYVTGLTSRYLADLYSFRFTLDQAVIPTIAGGVPADAIAGLDQIMSSMDARAQEGALTAFVELDMAFHTAFLGLGCNQFLLNALQSVGDVTFTVLTVTDRLFALRPHVADVEEEMMRRARVRAHAQAGLPQVARGHREILDAVRRGDAGHALDALRSHYENGEDVLIGQTRDLGLVRVVVDGMNLD